MTLLVALGALGLLPVGPRTAAVEGSPPRPNFVVILTDDQRWDTIGRCTNGFDGLDLAAGADSCMPFLQQHLVANGTTFVRGSVTTSLCCPARASLLTGRYARHTGVLDNFSMPAMDDRSTIATWLDAAGYRTALVGKYGNGYGETASFPANYVPPGWDSWHAFWGRPDYWSYSMVHKEPGQDPSTVAYSGSTSAACSPNVVYSTDFLCGLALDFLDPSETDPFFLLFTPFAPHLEAWPPSRWTSRYAGLPLPRYPSYNAAPSPNPPSWIPRSPFTQSKLNGIDAAFRRILATNRAVDDAVDAMVRQLTADGRIDETVFVFTSDNGLARAEHRWEGKACEYEECHRVPFVVVCPPSICPGAQPGTVDQESFALNIDLAPTIAELAGVMPAHRVDGRSLVSLLNDPSTPWRTSYLLEDQGIAPTNRPQGIVSLEDDGHVYKYVRFVAASTQFELYDLTLDPWELTNLAGDGVHTQIQARLAAALGAAQSPPVIAITQEPPAESRATTAAFGWTADEDAAFECALDGGPHEPCGAGTTGSVTYADLAVGTHTFGVRGLDVDGNTSPEVLRSFTITTELPAPTLTSVPPNPSRSDVAFSFLHPEPDVVLSCSLDGAPFSPCVSPRSYVGLAGGAHSFQVTATAQGGPTSTATTYGWTVDATPPTVTMSGAQDALLTGTSVGASWTGADDTGIVRYDVFERVGTAGTPVLVRSSTATNYQRPGSEGVTYCFDVDAYDLVGNVGRGAERCRAVPRDDAHPSLLYLGPVTAIVATNAFGSTLTALDGPGQEASLTFSGRRFGILVRRDPGSGMVDVFLDGAFVRRLDLYRATTGDRIYVYQQAVPPGTHTVRLVWTGARNASSTGTAVYLDGIGTIDA